MYIVINENKKQIGFKGLEFIDIVVGLPLIMFILLLFGAFIILTMFITATIAIKIYKFMRVKSVVANSGLEQTITFAKKNKNKKVNKIVKHLDDAEDEKNKNKAEDNFID